MDRPNFLILGAARSGTHTLYHSLRRHPDVLMSTPKEPFFFHSEYERGLGYYWKTYFPGWRGQSAAGEACVGNLFVPYVPSRVRESLPEAKLVAILRNPVDRAFSHWWMKRSRGLESLPFEAALEENLARLESGETFEGPDGERLWRSGFDLAKGHTRYPVYLDFGYYALQLRRYLRLFPGSRLRVLIFDDLKRDPRGLLRELCEFLEIDPAQAPQEVRTEFPAFSTIERAVHAVARRAGLDRVIPLRIRAPLRKPLSRLGGRPRMSDEIRRWLVEHYRVHNHELEVLIGRDLTAWDGQESRA